MSNHYAVHLKLIYYWVSSIIEKILKYLINSCLKKPGSFMWEWILKGLDSCVFILQKSIELFIYYISPLLCIFYFNKVLKNQWIRIFKSEHDANPTKTLSCFSLCKLLLNEFAFCTYLNPLLHSWNFSPFIGVGFHN